MLKHLLLTLGIVLSTSLFVFSQSGALQGKILDTDTKDPIPFANVAIYSGGDLLTGSTSDFDGKFVIKPLTPGTYDIEASFVGYKSKRIAGVIVKGDQITFQDIELAVTAETLDVVEVVEYKVPLISKDKTTSGATVTSEEIQKMPNRSTNSIATTVGGVYSDADGGNISIRGQRSEGTVYYIDGMRVLGSLALPESAIEQVAVILGGVPAKYGDATGGIISATTKGPSRQFGAGLEAQTSQFLDAFGYNRLGVSLQGPLVSRTEANGNKTSLIGYFLAGDFVYREDGSPSAKGTLNQITDEYATYLRESPQRVTGTGFGLFNNSLFTQMEDTKEITNTQNTERTDISLSGKIDLRTSPTINLTVGGSFNLQDYKAFSYYNSLFNWENNAHVKNTTWRVFGRFTQRFPVDKESTSLVKNVFYSIQADYSKFDQTVEDDTHGDQLFNYGYLGKFQTYKRRSYELGSDTVNGNIYNNVWLQNNWQDTAYTYQAYDINPVVARYTEQYYELYPDKGDWQFNPQDGYWLNYNQVQLYGGLLNGQSPDAVYTMWGNIGAQYNGYQVTDNSQVGLSANLSADIGNHAIEFGLQYEQRTSRAYGYGPVGLWSIMRLYTNAHINELDKANPDLIEIDGVFQDTINYPRLYSFTDQRVFDINLRQKLGLNLQGTDWIDIDSYDPNTQTISYIDPDGNIYENVPVNGGLSVDMFSPDELLNDGNSYVFYYGYDPYGNKNSSRPAFDDFFNKSENILLPNGQQKEYFTRDIQAFEPIYGAFYIQDKFAFDDLIFNIGLRIDRFDANQNVLKDPYLFYSAFTVAEKPTTFDGQAHPSNITDDAVIYIDNKDNPSDILGYRIEDTWYNAQGGVIQNPNILDAGNGITPYLKNPSQTELSSDVFEDYEPQWSFMPRISFSFPISDEALFFAHYDILTQRPTSSLRMDPTQYLFIDRQGAINNPNLKPEKTIDYELGFQQKVSNTSSLKISTFYREIRDQIQYFRFTGAYTGGSNLYDSYSNLDFATVKGLTVEYDLRRTNNVRARVSYTLQFAEGTGSSANTAAALVNAGLPNLRTIFPLNWDRRHAFNIVLDYRFGEGKNYNGPSSTKQIKGTDQVKTTQWLKNTGLNLTLSGGSGTPYTRSENIIGVYAGGGGYVLDGTINGSRLPWQFRIDGRLDRDIDISKKPDSRTYLNVYLQVLNLLNTKNIINVYPATGSPDDDGYLTAPEWQSNIEASIDPQAYRDLYNLRMNSPFNFSTPRQIRLGVIFNF
jgi:outer membrane receptor protein involved in Fe transport